MNWYTEYALDRNQEILREAEKMSMVREATKDQLSLKARTMLRVGSWLVWVGEGLKTRYTCTVTPDYKSA
jgi:hypothetical protein